MPLRTIIRDLLPQRFGVPLRYAFNAAMGQLDPEVGLIGTELFPLRRRAIDIGANYGLYTYALARRARHVDAFEPVADCATFIRSWNNRVVRVHQMALSDREGEAVLHIPFTTGGRAPALASLADRHEESEEIIVRVATLDSFGFDDVDLVKIDVEGHELSVLRGATRTLRRCRPALIVEIEQRHLNRDGHAMREVFGFLDALDYDAFFMEPGRAPQLRPIAEFSYERHQKSHVSCVDDPSYVNNFAFVRRNQGHA